MSITETLSFITSEAGTEDLDQIIAAIKLRRQSLGHITAASVRVGCEVELQGLTPKYLNGLTGMVIEKKNNRVAVELDEKSTRTLKYSGQTRFFIPRESSTHQITGIPAGCVNIRG